MLASFKMAAGFVASIGAGMLCNEAIKMVRPKNANAFAKACIWVAGVGLSAVISDIAANGVEDVIDDAKSIAERIAQKREDL